MHNERSEPPGDGLHSVPGRVVRGMGNALAAGGAFTLLSLLLPHEVHAHDTGYVIVGVLFVLAGIATRAWAHRRDVGLLDVHATSVVGTMLILVLTWFGMLDLGGIQAVLLMIPLAISASLGPLPWSCALVGLQSGGYALVLATGDTALELDRPMQWVSITMGLLIGLLFFDLIRREMALTTRRAAAARDAREAQLAAHTERLQVVNDELARTNAKQDHFLAVASNELQTPLTSISGVATTISDRWTSLDDTEKLRFTRLIEEQSDRLRRLVRDLLTLSQIEARNIDVEVPAIELEPVLRRAIDHLGFDDVVVRCTPDLRVRASGEHVEQLLVHLLNNAAQHGASRIALTASGDAGATTIVVADNGPGVPAAFVPELFLPFAQADDTMPEPHRRAPGTGLGLPVVRGLARAYGGDAWYEPNDPIGSRFCVRLPAG